MGRTILTNASLLDGDNPAQPGRTITIDGDRILGVSTGPPADVTPDDRVVDVAGRTVMPGMVTCHFHSTYRELGSTSAPYGLEHPPAYQTPMGTNGAADCGDRDGDSMRAAAIAAQIASRIGTFSRQREKGTRGSYSRFHRAAPASAAPTAMNGNARVTLDITVLV